MKKYFDCTCNDETMCVYYDDEDESNFPQEVQISVFEKISKYKKRWRFGNKLLHKLKWIWQIIKYEHPYEDQILLDGQTVVELRDYLNDIIEKEMQ
jgi:hypothetical protein